MNCPFCKAPCQSICHALPPDCFGKLNIKRSRIDGELIFAHLNINIDATKIFIIWDYINKETRVYRNDDKWKILLDLNYLWTDLTPRNIQDKLRNILIFI